MDRLKGKKVLITGGSSGIGLATAKLFRDEGAELVITGWSPENLARAQEELGCETLVIRSDAGSLPEIDLLATLVKERLGRVDVLFLNAGTASLTPLERVSEQQFDAIVNVNLKGVFFTIQKLLPLMGDGASIIATTSISNTKSAPNFSVYGASKAALRSLVQSLGVTLIGSGIRFNAISPGPIATPMYDRLGISNDMIQAHKRDIVQKSPIKRFGTPEEVAKVALFLASDDSAYLVGEEVVVDGGIRLL